MKPYQEIKNVYKRDVETHQIISGAFTNPEFEYLFDNDWNATEKINGTNIRVQYWGSITDFASDNGIIFKGRTEKADTPQPKLYSKLEDLFPPEKLRAVFADADVCLYGEGYGSGIQKGGGRYIPDGVDYILFDVFINDPENRYGGWWLRPEDVRNTAEHLGIKYVPIIGYMGEQVPLGPTITLRHAIEIVSAGQPSTFGDFEAEGLVLRPVVEMFARNGSRVIVKVKARDFNNEP